MVYIKNLVNAILAKHTGQALDKIEKDTDRDFILYAEAAKEYGNTERIIQKR
jgi:ATP-dependent Clp protease protease subunit